MTVTEDLFLSGRHGSAYAADGCRLEFVLCPSEVTDARRVVLVHALGMSSRQWDEAVLALRGRCHLLRFDCRGHGRSERRRGPYSCELFAEDLSAVLDAVAWPSAVVAGCSMGGCVAQAFGARRPERTEGLILIDTTATYGADAAPKWFERARQAIEEGMSSLVDFQLERWFTGQFRDRDPVAVARCLEIFLANDPNCYAASCEMLAEADLRSALVDIVCPTVVLVGEHDQATPLHMSEELASRIASARLVVLPNAKHFSPVEQPGDIAREILRIADASRQGALYGRALAGEGRVK